VELFKNNKFVPFKINIKIQHIACSLFRVFLPQNEIKMGTNYNKITLLWFINYFRTTLEKVISWHNVPSISYQRIRVRYFKSSSTCSY